MFCCTLHRHCVVQLVSGQEATLVVFSVVFSVPPSTQSLASFRHPWTTPRRFSNAPVYVTGV